MNKTTLETIAPEGFEKVAEVIAEGGFIKVPTHLIPRRDRKPTIFAEDRDYAGLRIVDKAENNIDCYPGRVYVVYQRKK